MAGDRAMLFNPESIRGGEVAVSFPSRDPVLEEFLTGVRSARPCADRGVRRSQVPFSSFIPGLHSQLDDRIADFCSAVFPLSYT